MAKPVKVTDSTFDKLVVESEQPVLVDFWAEWCGPCKMIAPVLEEIATDLDGKLTIGKLDVDDNQSTAMAFGVMSIPTLLLFKGGKPVERIVGYQPKQQLLGKIAAPPGVVQRLTQKHLRPGEKPPRVFFCVICSWPSWFLTNWVSLLSLWYSVNTASQ